MTKKRCCELRVSDILVWVWHQCDGLHWLPMVYGKKKEKAVGSGWKMWKWCTCPTFHINAIKNMHKEPNFPYVVSVCSCPI